MDIVEYSTQFVASACAWELVAGLLRPRLFPWASWAQLKVSGTIGEKTNFRNPNVLAYNIRSIDNYIFSKGIFCKLPETVFERGCFFTCAGAEDPSTTCGTTSSRMEPSCPGTVRIKGQSSQIRILFTEIPPLCF